MIPNFVHFIFTTSPKLGGKPFSLTHYIAVKSVYAINKPKRIFFHYEHEPTGKWWELAKPMFTLNRICLPEEIFGNPILHMAHQADIIRLQVLSEIGGIYLDLDTICIKPYGDLLGNEVVMGLQPRRPVFYHPSERILYNIKRTLVKPFVKLPTEGIRGLANTVIMAKAKARFLQLWLESYRTFRGTGLEELYWDEHSVRMPYAIARENQELVTMLGPESFYFPFYDDKGLKLMFEKNTSFPNAIIHHLWESVSWNKYCKDLTPEDIRTKDTTYNLIARPYLENII